MDFKFLVFRLNVKNDIQPNDSIVEDHEYEDIQPLIIMVAGFMEEEDAMSFVESKKDKNLKIKKTINATRVKNRYTEV